MGLCASQLAAAKRLDGPVSLKGVQPGDLTTFISAALAARCGTTVELEGDAGESPGTARMGSVMLEPLTLAQLESKAPSLATWVRYAVGVPDSAETDAFLNDVSNLASTLAGILNKPAPPAQKKLRPVAMSGLASLEAALVPMGGDPAEMPPTHVAALVAVLCWLLPAAEHCRWFRPISKPGSFPRIHAVQERLQRLLGYRDLGVKLPPLGNLQLYWGSPKVIKRGGALGIGRIQHTAMRTMLDETKDAAADAMHQIEAFAATPSSPLPDPAAVRRMATVFGWFVDLVAAHSVLEDDVIYKTLEAKFPGCTAMHTVEHRHEIPAFAALKAQVAAAAEAYAALADDAVGADDAAAIHEALEAEKAAFAARGEAAKHEHEEWVAEAAALKAKLTGADGDATEPADAEGMHVETGTPEGGGDSGATDAVHTIARLWGACADVVASRSAAEEHFVGEETNLFPRLQKLTPEEHKTTFLGAFASCNELREDLLPVVLGFVNPAQADQYMYTIYTHADVSADRWRRIVSYLPKGVTDRKMTDSKFSALLARCPYVKTAHEANVAEGVPAEGVPAVEAAEGESAAATADTPAAEAAPAPSV